MSETVSLEFIGGRLDSMQDDVRDVRRSMISLRDRFSGIEDRLSGIEGRLRMVEKRIGTIETRLDDVVHRQSAFEGPTGPGAVADRADGEGAGDQRERSRRPSMSQAS